MKILTVVIPTYNVEKYLERCLDSLTYDESILDDLCQKNKESLSNPIIETN